MIIFPKKGCHLTWVTDLGKRRTLFLYQYHIPPTSNYKSLVASHYPKVAVCISTLTFCKHSANFVGVCQIFKISEKYLCWIFRRSKVLSHFMLHWHFSSLKNIFVICKIWFIYNTWKKKFDNYSFQYLLKITKYPQLFYPLSLSPRMCTIVLQINHIADHL